MVTETSPMPRLKLYEQLQGLQISLVAKPGGTSTGVGRYVCMLQQQLEAAGVTVMRIAPATPGRVPESAYALAQRAGMDIRAFLTNYPITASLPFADIHHLTSQNLASLLLFRRHMGTEIVTVHDIIPFMLRNNPELSSYKGPFDRFFDLMAMLGLKRANMLLADSHYTKRSLTEYLRISPKRIKVIYLGVDHTRYQPVSVPDVIYDRYSLQKDKPYIIYVGSEDPRKNLTTLVRALALLRGTMPTVELIKVGRAHFQNERLRLVKLAEDLGVLLAIHFLDEVPEADMSSLYSLSRVAAMPSLYEGFGFPVLEAQACGTPVVCARAGSLPEVSGGACIFFESTADMAQNLCTALLQLLRDNTLYDEMHRRGLANAARFHWAHTTEQVLAQYAGLAHMAVGNQ